VRWHSPYIVHGHGFSLAIAQVTISLTSLTRYILPVSVQTHKRYLSAFTTTWSLSREFGICCVLNFIPPSNVNDCKTKHRDKLVSNMQGCLDLQYNRDIFWIYLYSLFLITLENYDSRQKHIYIDFVFY